MSLISFSQEQHCSRHNISHTLCSVFHEPPLGCAWNSATVGLTDCFLVHTERNIGHLFHLFSLLQVIGIVLNSPFTSLLQVIGTVLNSPFTSPLYFRRLVLCSILLSPLLFTSGDWYCAQFSFHALTVAQDSRHLCPLRCSLVVMSVLLESKTMFV